MQSMEFQCSNCRQSFTGEVAAEELVCSHCGRKLARTAQLAQILEKWYYPRRWFRDVPKMSVSLLIEMLWTADGQGEKLFGAVAPPNTNYSVFLNQVSRVIIKGVDEGWARIDIPEDPFSDNPVYKLSYLDSDRFADSVAALFPDVNWEETILVEEADEAKS